MFESVDDLSAALEALVRGIDPALVTPADADRVIRRLARIAKLAEAAVTVVAARACESNSASDEAGGPGAYVGKVLGISTTDGRRIVEASTHLHTAPLVRERLLAGGLSPLQAAAVIEARRAAQAAHLRREAERLVAEKRAAEAGEANDAGSSEAEAPSSARAPDDVERDLLGEAERSTIGRLREAAERHKAAARDEADQARHLHATRFWRPRRYADGGVGGKYKLAPEVAARLHALVEAETDRRFNQARRDGTREARQAYAADALCALAEQQNDGRGSRPASARRSSPDFVVRIDLAALLRGGLDAGEVCEIPGCGPVPVSTARRLLGNSLVNLLIHDGVDVRTVVCGGRRASKALAVAVMERDPYCVDCGAAFRLEMDHAKPDSLDGETSYANLHRRCWRCHGRKTRAEAHLTIPAGRARAARQPERLRPTGTDPP